MEINYWAVLVCGIVSMIIGSIWYGPLFGKAWMKIVGVTAEDMARRQEMQKKAAPLYAVQFLLSLFQAYIVAYILNYVIDAPAADSPAWMWTLIIWAGFVMPTVAGASMWNNDSAKISWSRFLIQAGYQLVNLLVFGLILGMWR